MPKFWIVLTHTYLSRLKSKSFIITTALFLLFIAILGNLDSIISLFDREEEPDHIAVIDNSGEFYPILNEQVNQGDHTFELKLYEGTLDEAEQAVLGDNYIGVLELDDHEEEILTAAYYTDQLVNQSIQHQLENYLHQIKVGIATKQVGIDQDIITSIYQPISFDTIAIEHDDGTTARTQEEIFMAQGLVYIMLFALYFAVITYGNMIAMDIANEKSSRVMEILISSSAPIGQMTAKISGIALLGLTQIGIFVLAGYLMVYRNVGDFLSNFGLADIPITTFIYAFIFFVLGYLLYATLSAMLGSLVSRIEDVNQLMLPVTLLIIAAFFIAIFFGLENPETSFITITSYFPFFTPFVMFLRIGLLDIPTWEIVLSMGVMVVTIIIIAIIGAKVYRGGVLMYGRGTSLKDFKQALQLAKKEK